MGILNILDIKMKYWLNKHRSEETKKKISRSLKGRKLSKKTRLKMSKVRKGKKKSEEHKRKIGLANSISLKGKHPISEFKKGHKINLGKHHSNKIRKQISEKIKIINSVPENCPNWRGGISFEPYSVDWTDTLKRAIKERDRFRCRLCYQDKILVVHHIDYNKKNSNSNNLITLCSSCHGKTNYNREKWKKIFKQMMK